MLTTGITNPTVIPKDGRLSRLTPRSASKPFVVCSISTKRYAGSKTSKMPEQRSSPTVRPTSSRDGPHVPNEAQAKHTGRSGSVPSFVSTATRMEARRAFTKPALAPDPGEPPPRLKTSAPFSRLTSKDRSLSQKAIGLEQTNVVERTKEDITTCHSLETARPTQLMTANEAPPRPSGIKAAVNIPTTRTAVHAVRTGYSVNNPSISERHPGVPLTPNERLTLRNPVKLTTVTEPFLRPSCVPRGRLPRSSVRATLTSKGRQEIIVKGVILRPRNPGIKVDIPTTQTRAHAPGVGPSVEEPVSERRNERLTLHTPVVYPDVNWSPPPSPDLSSFPSQSWTIAISVDVKQEQAKITTTVCSEEIPTSTYESEESGSTDLPGGCHGSFELGSTSPAFSSSSTVISTPPNPDLYISGMDGTLDVGSLRKGPSVEVSPTDGAAKIISRSRNGSTSADTLAKIMERSQAGSPTRNSNAENRTRMAVRSAFEIARNLFSRSQRVSQAVPEAAVVKTNGTDVSRVRKLFVPPLEEDARPSANPMIQMEIEMLRTWKKVAGGAVVNPLLQRLGSLSAMAIATKLNTSSPDRV